jgi:hypothetical protein
MDYVPPLDVVSNMVGAGSTKGSLPAKDLLIRGFLSGALLGFATHHHGLVDLEPDTGYYRQFCWWLDLHRIRALSDVWPQK